MTTALEIAAFYRQLGTMIEAGLSLARCLDTLTRSAPTRQLREISGAIRRSIDAGGDFSDGLAQYPRLFPALDRELIRVGEQSGTLDRQLEHLAELLERSAAIRKEVFISSLYPLLLLHLAVLVAPLVRFVVTGDVAASLLSALSGLLWLYGAGALVWFAARQIAMNRRVSIAVESLLLALPLFGPIHRSLSIARFFGALKALLNAGVGLLQALPRAGAACGSAVLAAAAAAAVAPLRKSELLAVALERVLPADAVSLLASGQESGKLDQTLEHLEGLFLERGRSQMRLLAQSLPKAIYIAVVFWVGWQVLQMGLSYSRALSSALDQ